MKAWLWTYCEWYTCIMSSFSGLLWATDSRLQRRGRWDNSVAEYLLLLWKAQGPSLPLTRQFTTACNCSVGYLTPSSIPREHRHACGAHIFMQAQTYTHKSKGYKSFSKDSIGVEGATGDSGQRIGNSTLIYPLFLPTFPGLMQLPC